MPALPSLPTLNGYAPSFADISCRATKSGVPLLRVEDLKEVNTGVSVAIGSARSGGRKGRRTKGSPDPSASIVLYRHGYHNLLRRIAPFAPLVQGVRRVSLVTFDLIFQHTPPIEPPDVPEFFECHIVGCRLQDRQFNDAEGDDPNEVSLALDVNDVYDVVDGQKIGF